MMRRMVVTVALAYVPTLVAVVALSLPTIASADCCQCTTSFVGACFDSASPEPARNQQDLATFCANCGGDVEAGFVCSNSSAPDAFDRGTCVALPSPTPTPTPAPTPTPTFIPFGDACTTSEMCASGSVCRNGKCEAPAPAASRTGVVIVVVLLAGVGLLQLVRRRATQ